MCAGRSHLQVVVAPEQVLDLPPKICAGHANLLFHLPLSKVATLRAVSLGHEVVCDVGQLVEEDQQAEVAAVLSRLLWLWRWRWCFVHWRRFPWFLRWLSCSWLAIKARGSWPRT